MAQQSRVGTHATKIHQHGENTYITYWSTDVVAFDSKWIMLRHGGWMTPTTKTRMNQAARQFSLGYTVYQKAGQWYAITPEAETIPFGPEGWVAFSRNPAV